MRNLTDPPEVALSRAEAALAAAQSLSFTLVGSVRDRRPDRDPLRLVTAQAHLQRPNLARVTLRERVQRRQGGWQTRERTLFADGTHLWEWDSEGNVYRKTPLDPQGRNIDGPSIAPLRMFFHGRIPHAEEPPRADRGGGAIVFETPPLVRQELTLGRDALPRRWTNRQMRGLYVEEWELTQVRVGEPQPLARFAFVPPPGATEWQRPKPPQLLAAGTPAPELAAVDRQGKPVRLADLRGRTVVLEFWASWCGPCQETLPIANALAKKYADVAFLAVNVWDKPEAAKTYLEKHRDWDALTFAFDHTPPGKDIATVGYKAPGLPTQYVIGKDGRIVRGLVGFGDPAALEKAIAG